MNKDLARGHGGRPPDENDGDSSDYASAASALEPRVETERSRPGSRNSSFSHSVSEDFQVYF